MLQAEVLFKLHVLPQIYLFIYFWLNSVKFIAIIRGKKGGGDGGGVIIYSMPCHSKLITKLLKTIFFLI